MTNKEFAEADQFFQLACQAAGINGTARQASRFRNNKGLARQYQNAARQILIKKEWE